MLLTWMCFTVKVRQTEKRLYHMKWELLGFFFPVLTLSYFNGASLGHHHASQNNALLPNKIIYIFIVVHKHWLILNAHKHTFNKAKRSEKSCVLKDITEDIFISDLPHNNRSIFQYCFIYLTSTNKKMSTTMTLIH